MELHWKILKNEWKSFDIDDDERTWWRSNNNLSEASNRKKRDNGPEAVGRLSTRSSRTVTLPFILSRKNKLFFKNNFMKFNWFVWLVDVKIYVNRVDVKVFTGIIYRERSFRKTGCHADGMFIVWKNYEKYLFLFNLKKISIFLRVEWPLDVIKGGRDNPPERLPVVRLLTSEAANPDGWTNRCSSAD